MELGLEGKRVLVTGASAGLGAAAALALAAEKAQVVINSRDAKKLNAAADRIEKAAGQRPAIVVGDVAKAADRVKVINATREAVRDGVIDVLVSNAGGPPPGQFLDHSGAAWSDAAELVLNSAIGMTRAFLPGMVEQKFGRLIYITSIGVLQPVDELILSNTYRAGVTGFCKTLSNNYAKFGVTANCVCPGYTGTERLASLMKSRAEAVGTTPKEVIDTVTENIPARRVGRPEELAALITFLASDRASYITGASIPVDGGLHKGLL